MKNLFTIGSSIVIEAFSSLRITGPYELLKLGANAATIQSSHYVVEVVGEDLIIEKLAEELAVFTFEKIERLTVVKAADRENEYGT